MSTFSELGVPEALTTALTQLGITTPFPIQAATLPDSLAGRDVLGRGRTGSGKTIAFGLAFADTLLEGAASFGPAREPLALIIAPTRELALQVQRGLEQTEGDPHLLERGRFLRSVHDRLLTRLVRRINLAAAA